jgi:hypothetical protein
VCQTGREHARTLLPGVALAADAFAKVSSAAVQVCVEHKGVWNGVPYAFEGTTQRPL